MTPERWQRVKEICQSLLDLKPSRREELLEEMCAGDQSLMREVRSLLAQESGGLFDAPALDAAARALADDGRAEMRQDLVGQTLRHYRIVEKIGEGGMGVVYRARDEHLKRDIAIKVLPPELMTDPERKKRFVQEARAASALNHPNIVTIYDVTSEGGIDFIAMELVAGKTLDQKIGRKGIKLDEALKFAVQIADALAAAHAAGIVHRDLKPANILVTESGHVKVLDFGLAKLTQPLNGERADSSSAAMSTEEGQIVGTAAYMSPEQAEGKPVDARSDIFSFGSVLYEMVTGRRAFQGESSASIISEILKSEPLPLNAGIPHDLEIIIARCLRKDPARRVKHMDDVWLALEDLKEESGSGEPSKTEPQPRSVRRRIATWATAAVLLFLGAGSAFLYLHRISREAPPADIVTLTNYPGTQGHPSFSPDGSRVAFHWDGPKEDNFDIYIKPVGSGPPRRLTFDPGAERSPRWSPDGNWIAFSRGGFVYLIPPEGGKERRLCRGVASSWSPDSRFLAIQRRESSETPTLIYLVSAEAGEESGPVTSPPSQSLGDIWAEISPDGKSFAFARIHGRGGEFAADIYIQPIANGKPAGEAWRLTNDDRRVIGARAWTLDGSEIVFSSNRGGRRSLWRVAVSPGAEPRRVPGTDDAVSATVARGTPGRLVYSRSYVGTSIWRKRIAEKGNSVGAPERLLASHGQEWDPQFSPEGSRIVLRSDRSGFDEIWVCRSDGSEPVQLTSFRGSRHAGAPRWSPDGQRIAFDSQGPNGVNIFIVNAEGGEPHKVTEGDWSDIRPCWSKDGQWIYFGSNRSGTNQIWKVSASGSNPRQVTQDGGFECFESLDGKQLFYTKGWSTLPGIWSMPTEAGKEAALPELALVRTGHWSIADNGIYFVDFGNSPVTAPPGPVPLRFYDFKTHRVSQLEIIERMRPLSETILSTTRDGRWIVWKLTDREEYNLMLIDNFR